MSKIKLEFLLDEIEDSTKIHRLINCDEMSFVLFEIYSNMRKKMEYAIESENIQDPIQVLDKCMEYLGSLMDEQDLILEKLIN